MSVPGVGAVTALAFKTAVDDPHRFVHSADVGPHFGLTPRRYQSGEVDRSGRISKCGDALVRSLRFEDAIALLNRVRAPSSLKRWARALARRGGTRQEERRGGEEWVRTCRSRWPPNHQKKNQQ